MKEAWFIQILVQPAAQKEAGGVQERTPENASAKRQDQCLNVDIKQQRNVAKEGPGHCVDAVQYHHVDVEPLG